MAAETDTRKVTVSLPSSLLDRLDDKVPPRRRSDFIARAIEEQLTIADQVEAIAESAGVWRDEDYPDMVTEEAMDRWLAELRGPASLRDPEYPAKDTPS